MKSLLFLGSGLIVGYFAYNYFFKNPASTNNAATSSVSTMPPNEKSTLPISQQQHSSVQTTNV